MNVRSRNRRAFTLVEILLVILIIASLATVLAINLLPAKEGSKINITKIKLEKVLSGLNRYSIDLDQFPTEDQGLKALTAKPSFDNEDMGKNWHGPYLEADDLKDSWNNDIQYKLADVDNGQGGTRKTPHVYSKGPNGNDQNGDGDNIKNKAWESESAAQK